MILRTGLMITTAVAAATPALAHMGDHSHYAIRELAEHLLEWDHLLLLGLAGLIGFVTFRAGRRSEARRTLVDRRRDGK